MKKSLLLFCCLILLGGCNSSSDGPAGAAASKSTDTEQTNKVEGQSSENDGLYDIGVGIYDITGPAAEVTMGGFAFSDQKTAGISTRLWARTFIVNDGAKSVVFVNADAWSMSQGVKQEVARIISEDEELKYDYSNDNIAISATHTHSGIAGFSHYFLYNVPNMGYIDDSFRAVADGIVESIRRAHRNIEPGHIYVNRGDLFNASWNRGTEGYANNPAEERAKYKREFDGKTVENNVDTEMTLLKFVAEDGRPMGALSWFAVHPDTIGKDNHLVSGDSKGIAAYLWEQQMGSDYNSEKPFVAAFAQANSGDNTPNVPFTNYKWNVLEDGKKKQECIEEATAALTDIGYSETEAGAIIRTQLPLDEAKSEPYIFENIVLEVQVMKHLQMAKDLFAEATTPVTGSVDFRHEFVDFSNVDVAEKWIPEGEHRRRTAPAGMGASYSFGSPSDNPTPFPLFGVNVTREDIESWENVQESLLCTLLPGVQFLIFPGAFSDEYKDLHAEKPVLLDLGELSLNINDSTPIPLVPQILPVQVLKIGNVAIASQPTELTTMSGRRIKDQLIKSFTKENGEKLVDYGVIAGLTNTYASYMSTREEYEMQTYAGGGTWFGPLQLSAFMQEYDKLAQAIVKDEPVAAGPAPLDLRDYQHNFAFDQVVMDDVPSGKSYGQQIGEIEDKYEIGKDAAVEVSFWGSHPRNNRRTMDSYFEIINVETNEVVRRDWDYDTEFKWERDGTAYSKVTVVWHLKDKNADGLPEHHKAFPVAEKGTYKIKIYGSSKSLLGEITPYEGTSQPFTISE